MPDFAKTDLQPRLVGFLCETGAYGFYDVSNPLRRKLPANFVGLAVANVGQVRTSDVLKAFLAGADGVLVAGCESCHRQQNLHEFEQQFHEIAQTLAGFGIEALRLRLEWISASEEEKFLRVVNETMQKLRQLPELRLPAAVQKSISHCG